MSEKSSERGEPAIAQFFKKSGDASPTNPKLRIEKSKLSILVPARHSDEGNCESVVWVPKWLSQKNKLELPDELYEMKLLGMAPEIAVAVKLIVWVPEEGRKPAGRVPFKVGISASCRTIPPPERDGSKLRVSGSGPVMRLPVSERETDLVTELVAKKLTCGSVPLS